MKAKLNNYILKNRSNWSILSSCRYGFGLVFIFNNHIYKIYDKIVIELRWQEWS